MVYGTRTFKNIKVIIVVIANCKSQALHCCEAMDAKLYRKIVTSDKFISELCTRHYLGELNHHAILFSIGSVGLLPKYIKYNSLIL